MIRELYIKNMVCPRCLRAVERIVTELGYHVLALELGSIRIETAQELDLHALRVALEKEGFALLEDQKGKTVEQIKTLIIELVHSGKLDELSVNLSTYLSDRIGKDYISLSHLFSSMESITIERYFILQKIERVKELLAYGEMTVSEIAFELGYSSVAHLSSQFKGVTGFSPKEFRSTHQHQRQPLDKLHKNL